MGLAFFFASLHVLFIPTDVTILQSLRYYMWFLISTGFIAFFYRTVLGMFIVRGRSFIVERVDTITKNVIEIFLRPEDGKPMRYYPGQFIFIGFPGTASLEEVHPFSISSSPDNSSLAFSIKALGDFTTSLLNLKAGTRAVIEGPFGRSSYRYYGTKEQIWIAGGIGITPFLGMARSLKHDDGYKVDLYYSALSVEDAAFHDELSRISTTNPNFRFIPWYGKEKGYLSAESIIKESGGVLGKEIFVCGPPPMMKSLKQQFAKYKVPTGNIHSEEFSLN